MWPHRDGELSADLSTWWENHKGQLLLAFAYFVVWAVFGLLYQWRANVTNGRAFTFQEDLKVSSQVLEFKKRNDLRVDDKIIKNLIPTCSWGFADEGKTTGSEIFPCYAQHRVGLGNLLFKEI